VGQVVKGPWRSPSTKDKLKRELAILRELIEAYKAEDGQKKGGA